MTATTYKSLAQINNEKATELHRVYGIPKSHVLSLLQALSYKVLWSEEAEKFTLYGMTEFIIKKLGFTDGCQGRTYMTWRCPDCNQRVGINGGTIEQHYSGPVTRCYSVAKKNVLLLALWELTQKGYFKNVPQSLGSRPRSR